MKIIKNKLKSKLEGFNVWDIYTSLSELMLIAFIIVAVLLLLLQPNLIDIKIP